MNAEKGHKLSFILHAQHTVLIQLISPMESYFFLFNFKYFHPERPTSAGPRSLLIYCVLSLLASLIDFYCL